jgi:hypothetical protein
MVVGLHTVRITLEAEADWQKECEAEAAAARKTAATRKVAEAAQAAA